MAARASEVAQKVENERKVAVGVPFPLPSMDSSWRKSWKSTPGGPGKTTEPWPGSPGRCQGARTPICMCEQTYWMAIF
eukprot:9476176-Pyramimonas_sp.AAC.1